MDAVMTGQASVRDIEKFNKRKRAKVRRQERKDALVCDFKSSMTSLMSLGSFRINACPIHQAVRAL
jgi:hypothetical protein